MHQVLLVPTGGSVWTGVVTPGMMAGVRGGGRRVVPLLSQRSPVNPSAHFSHSTPVHCGPLHSQLPTTQESSLPLEFSPLS